MSNRWSDVAWVAFHEAGHAVVAYALKRKFKKVTIVPNKKRHSAGCLHMYPSRFDIYDNTLRARLSLERHVMILCGGVVTMKWGLKKSTSKKDWRYLKNNDHDITRAMFLLDAFVGGKRHKGSYNMRKMECPYDWADEEAQRYFDLLWIRTEKILDDPKWWYASESLARELIRARTLKFKEASSIIDEIVAAHEE